MNDDLSTKISQLPTLNRAQLLPIWREKFTVPPPPTLRKELMVPILAYRIQEREFGGLSHSARTKLRELGKGQKPKTRAASPDLDTGTKLIRVWRGQTYEVIASQDGYQYKGQRYTSLSKLAKEITGTHWSGPAFFGVRGKSK